VCFLVFSCVFIVCVYCVCFLCAVYCVLFLVFCLLCVPCVFMFLVCCSCVLCLVFFLVFVVLFVFLVFCFSCCFSCVVCLVCVSCGGGFPRHNNDDNNNNNNNNNNTNNVKSCLPHNHQSEHLHPPRGPSPLARTSRVNSAKSSRSSVRTHPRMPSMRSRPLGTSHGVRLVCVGAQRRCLKSPAGPAGEIPGGLELVR